jgi:hypothetical protein
MNPIRRILEITLRQIVSSMISQKKPNCVLTAISVLGNHQSCHCSETPAGTDNFIVDMGRKSAISEYGSGHTNIIDSYHSIICYSVYIFDFCDVSAIIICQHCSANRYSSDQLAENMIPYGVPHSKDIYLWQLVW